MTREQLEHAIRAACEVAGDTELWVFGSQAILAQYPDAPVGLRASIEVDVQPKNRPDAVDAIDGALGELSLFHGTHGFYVHGVAIDSAVLPEGWKQRVTQIRHPETTLGNTGWCIEPHDLAASKLAAYRQKDREFVRTLLAENMIDAKTLTERIRALGFDVQQRSRLLEWVEATVEDLGSGMG